MEKQTDTLRKSIRFHMDRPAEAYAWQTLKESDSAASLAVSSVCVFLACFKQGPYAQVEILRKAIGCENRMAAGGELHTVYGDMPALYREVRTIGFKFNPNRPDHRYVYRVLTHIASPAGFLTEAVLVYQALFGMGPYAGVLVGHSDPLPIPAEFSTAGGSAKPEKAQAETKKDLSEPSAPDPAEDKQEEPDSLELSAEEIASLSEFFQV